MSLVQEMQWHAQDVQRRLRNPINAVRDLGVDLKRKVIPIKNADIPADVPVTSLDVFGPKLRSIDDMAFGPVVLGRQRMPLRKFMIDDIQRIVAARYKFSQIDLLSDRRTKPIMIPRQVAVYLSKILTLNSLPEIGRRFGGRDHTTILHSVRKIERLRQSDPALNDIIVELIATIQADARV